MLIEAGREWLYGLIGMLATGFVLYIWDKIKWGHGLMSKEKKRMFLQEVNESIEKVAEKSIEKDNELEEQIRNLNADITIIKEAMFDQRYEKLVEISEKYIAANYISLEDLKMYHEKIEVYHKLGANGRLDPWIDKVNNLPNIKQN